MIKKVTAFATIAAFATTVVGAGAAVLGRDYSGFDEDTTAVVYGTGGAPGAAYFYGFEQDPTSTSVNLDNVSGGGVGDFHTSSAPTFDLANGIASNAGAPPESLMRTDFGGSLWRAQFQTLDSYTIEVKINLLGTGTEGTNGVLGIFGQNDVGEHAVNIGTGTIDINGVEVDSALDNTGWHTWRVEVLDTAEYFLYRDGTQIGGSNALGAATGDRNFVGDFSPTGFGGDWQMEYLVMDTNKVPEPSSAALLGLGGLALILRRRK